MVVDFENLKQIFEKKVINYILGQRKFAEFEEDYFDIYYYDSVNHPVFFISSRDFTY